MRLHTESKRVFVIKHFCAVSIGKMIGCNGTTPSSAFQI